MQAILLVSLLTLANAPTNPKTELKLDYDRDIRPILKANCFHCHGEQGVKEGGLDLRLRSLIMRGGDSGPSIQPGHADDSLLLQRIVDGEMPPEDIEKRLTEAEIEKIKEWIQQGAPVTHPEPEAVGDGPIFTVEERNFWAFQPVKRPEVPKVKHPELVRTPVDAFLLAKLEAQQMSFNPEASKATLLRRAYMALTGLPPTPEQARAFLQDSSPDAYERLIDTLLESTHYGERWGRHWLDVAGYADSEGYTSEDVERPDAFRYRDYVIRSFNQNKPIDVFIREQLAGDEMIPMPKAELTPDDVEKLVATGFLRMAPDGTAVGGVDAGVARNQVVIDTLQIVTGSLMGLTVACAQCHDHRYDPIPQTDYYRLRAIFDPAYDWKNWRVPKARRVSLYTKADREKAAEIQKQINEIAKERSAKQQEYIQATFERELAKLPEELRGPIREARETPEKKRTPEQQKLLREHPSVNVSAGSLYLYDPKAAADLKSYSDRIAEMEKQKPVEGFVRALTEVPGKVPVSQLMHRGDHEQLKQEVKPGGLAVLGDRGIGDIPENDPNLPTTGRRLEFAKRLTNGKHPLTARVFVNRVWMLHFGKGIVETVGDFGYLGQRPTHPELLDWLADEFVRQKWDLKWLHRLLLTSTAYRQSSYRDPQKESKDPSNYLYGRMEVRRLDAEIVRDSILAVSGKLNPKQFGPPIPVMADEVGQWVIGIENLNAGRPGAVIPMNGEDFRRSVYVQVRRSRPLSVLESFDAPRMEPNCEQRSASTVAPQSLMLMNSNFAHDQSRYFAQRVISEFGSELPAQVRGAWEIAFGQPPTDEQTADAVAFVQDQLAYYSKNPMPKPDPKKKSDTDIYLSPSEEALATYCHALISSNAFLYVD